MSTSQFKPTKWTFLFLMLSAMMILMGGAAIAPALPLISQAFPSASETTISLIITLPALAIALTGIFIGVLSDKIGKIPVLVTSIAIFTLAGSSGFYLTSIYAILVGRVLLGIGYCSLGLAASLVTVGFVVIFIGLGEGILMPTVLNRISTITPKQFLGRAGGGF